MKIQLISDSKLKIIFNLKDLEENNISLHSFLSGSQKSTTFLKAIIEIAHEDFGFNINHKNFSYDTFYFNPSEFMIMVYSEKNNTSLYVHQTIEKHSNIENSFRDTNTSEFSSFKFIDNKLSNSTLYPQSIFYSFYDFEKFLEISKYIKNYITISIPNSFLYQYENIYLLEISTSHLSNADLNQLILLFSEICANIICSDFAITRFKEFGKLIIPKNALNF
ncbi:MAG: adaptor protein MecA [Clostridia bacterium]|nr:adaptor protein MecA [Clostridia bacterium]